LFDRTKLARVVSHLQANQMSGRHYLFVFFNNGAKLSGKA